ncbi:MAG: Crp/Fnr family transcriptional regulator [Pseudomonadota bacterium]
MAGHTSSEILEIVARNQILNELDRHELGELCALGQVERYAKGGIIFDKGDPGDRLYAVLSGQVGINSISADGKELILNIMDPSEIFGEVAVLDGGERTAGAVAMQVTELLRIRRSEFLSFLERHPKLAIRLLFVLCDRLRRATDIIEDTVFLDIPRRLAKRLLSLMERHGEPCVEGIRITIKLSQEDLGHMLGATRESVNKGIRALQRFGAISYDGGHLIVRNVEQLEDLIDQ